MANLVAINHEVFIESFGSSLIRFDGTGIQCKTSRAKVGEVANLAEWQQDPGRYGPHYAVAALTSTENGAAFWAAGSWPYITAWAREHQHAVGLARIFDDRNVARNLAEKFGGVAW